MQTEIIDTAGSTRDKNITGEILDTVVYIDEYFDDPLVKSYQSSSDTLVVAEDCVIFLWPDSLDIEELKGKHPDAYTDILEEMIYYSSNAAMALDSLDIKNFFCDKPVIQFINLDNSTFISRKKASGDMILFKAGNKPKITKAFNFSVDECAKFFLHQTTIVLDTIN